MMKAVVPTRVRRALSRRMAMDCMIWWGMFGSGVMTRQGPPGSSGAGVGSTTRPTSVAASSTGPTRTTPTPASASGLPAVKHHDKAGGARMVPAGFLFSEKRRRKECCAMLR
jgi:hypothetical protein